MSDREWIEGTKRKAKEVENSGKKMLNIFNRGGKLTAMVIFNFIFFMFRIFFFFVRLRSEINTQLYFSSFLSRPCCLGNALLYLDWLGLDFAVKTCYYYRDLIALRQFLYLHDLQTCIACRLIVSFMQNFSIILRVPSRKKCALTFIIFIIIPRFLIFFFKLHKNVLSCVL